MTIRKPCANVRVRIRSAIVAIRIPKTGVRGIVPIPTDIQHGPCSSISPKIYFQFKYVYLQRGRGGRIPHRAPPKEVYKKAARQSPSAKAARQSSQTKTKDRRPRYRSNSHRQTARRHHCYSRNNLRSRCSNFHQ